MLKKTKTQLVIEVARLVMTKYPARWTANEFAVMTNANIRTINRVLAEMTGSGLLEKKHSTYSLPLEAVNQLYGAKWYVKQEIDKDIILHKKIETGEKKNNEKTN